ncbi:MAG: BatD family protein [Candidatus Electrothrix sp. GW3-4]|uniref:BatD family protein n=1 Tax=Candidatus Electrothrix sp. GW3-4 TaxID=3126740 RepID=UPI0030CB3D3F
MQIWLLPALLTCILSVLVAATAAAADIQVTAELEPARFSEDQAARFVLTVTGARSAEPDMPLADGLHFVYQGQSSQASWVNGKISSSISYNFLVQAEKTGEFTVAPVKVTVEGKEYTSEPVQCTVLPVQNSGRQAGGTPSGTGGSATVHPDADEVRNIGFMRIMPDTDRIYSGQVVPFTLKAYFRTGKRVTLKSAPRLSGDDFLLQSLDEEPRQQQERLNGTSYTTLTWQGTLSAVREGAVSLTVEMDAEVLVRSRSRLRGSPFGSSLLDDPFFADILGNYSRRDVMVSSPEKTMTVLDLPTENRPEGFSGAIGTFSLAVAALPLNGKVGDPITVKMQLAGSGNFSLVQAPSLTEEQGWKVYPASGTVKDLGGGKGEKTFEQALIPTEQGLMAVPPVRFSYFDPKVEEYVTLTSEPIPLSLQAAKNPSASQAGTPGAPAVQNAPQGEKKGISLESPASQPTLHLAPLKPELGRLVPAIFPLYQKRWFQVLIAVALLCLFIAAPLYLRQRRWARDPSFLRHKEVQERLAGHYEGMKTALATQDQEAFRQHCRAAIQERAGEVWGLAPEAVTLADLEQRLADEAPLREVFVRLEQSGYAGEQLAQADLEEILQTTRNELDRLV